MTTIIARALGAAIIVAVAGADTAGAQGLANRVSSAPDGPVQFTFAARDGVCGNGKSYISTGQNSFYGSFTGSVSETVRTDPCVDGPVRVVLGRADRNVISVETFVGPAVVEPGATDLGAVPAREANEFLLSLAARLDGRPGKDAIFVAEHLLFRPFSRSRMPRRTPGTALRCNSTRSEPCSTVPVPTSRSAWT